MLSASSSVAFISWQRSSANEAAAVVDIANDRAQVARGAADGTGADQSAGNAVAGLVSSARAAS